MTEKTDGRNAGPHDYHLSGDGVEPAFQVEFKHFLLSPSSTLDFGFQNCSDMFLFSFKDERILCFLVACFIHIALQQRSLNIYLILKLPLRTLPNHLMGHKI